MLFRKLLSFGCLFVVLISGCKHNDPDKNNSGSLQLSSIVAGTSSFNLSSSPVATNVPIDQPVVISFSAGINTTTAQSSIILTNGTQAIDIDITYLNGNKTVSLKPKQSLNNNTEYNLTITNQLKGQNNETFAGIQVSFKTEIGTLSITAVKIGGVTITSNNPFVNVPWNLSVEIDFSVPLNIQTITTASVSITGPNSSALAFTFSNDNKTLTISRSTPLIYLSKYTLTLQKTIQGAQGEVFSKYTRDFYSELGTHTSGFPALDDNSLLDTVQRRTLKYFWSFAHPASGMARERNTSGNTVTTGGSGFGLMAIVAGIDRGFIPRASGIARFDKVVSFLTSAQRFHGAWPHWIDGNTGHVIPFSTNDDGADLVETSYMVQGLLTVRQYLTQSDTVGNNLINRINALWQGVEWDWFKRCDPNCHPWLYWHWSPDKAWIMNFALQGYFEEQITYFLAEASPTHSIAAGIYDSGYGTNGDHTSIVTGSTYTYNGESHVLPLGTPSPLFWVQYSYLGMDPHFSDSYANYWTQNVNASLINHAYCVANPSHFVGYADNCWGLTASDNPSGYDAQSPANDNGTITPTAALSSMPYSPTQSLSAIRFFYDKLGDRLWGPYGFYDAFNITDGWVADSYLAIDQGPIVVMIENYRSQLLWNLFESAPEVQAAKTKLGFINN